ncbi:MAG: Serine/threonine-protein kinase tel1 [Trizodia sp. TS-e1964]|nr:MAG: Serine/threonine-protein kinase tel1 [Trizodia sp. TS-e1964]
MAQVNIKEALKRATSHGVKERADGLADLKHMFISSRKGSKLDTLVDADYHHIYESLFQTAISEKATFLKSKKSANDKSRLRLGSCAEVLRLAVESGFRKLKLRTVKAVVDHIIQILPSTGEAYVEPLSLNYIKTLSTIIQYAPHVEHFSYDYWNLLVEFCNSGIRLLETTSELSGLLLANGDFFSPSASDEVARNRSRVQSLRRSSTGPHSKAITDEFVICLKHLFSAPNAPVLVKAHATLVVLLDFLQNASGAAIAHHAAFAVINSILLRTIVDSVSITNHSIPRLLPLIKRLWPTKSVSFKDELLITLNHTRPHLRNFLSNGNRVDGLSNVEHLLETLQHDYSKKLERDQLQLDDLSFYTRNQSKNWPIALGLAAFQLRNGALRSEQSWMTLLTIADLVLILDESYSDLLETSEETVNDTSHNKRRRKPHFFGESLRQTRASETPRKICGLQATCFLIEKLSLSEVQMKDTLDQMVLCVSDKVSNVSSWAMVCIASCAFQSIASAPSLSSDWLGIWRLAARNATSASSCRAACHLMHVILDLKIVTFSSVADMVESNLASLDISGPAIPADSALSLWALILRKRNHEILSGSMVASERLLHWFFKKWNPDLFTERGMAFHYALLTQPAEILDLFFSCTGRLEPTFKPDFSLRCGLVAQMQLFALENQPLLDYLLLNDEPPRNPTPQIIEDTPIEVDSRSRFHSNELLILEFLATSLKKSKGAWASHITERPQHVTQDMLRVLANLCVIADIILSSFVPRDSHRAESLRACLETLSVDIVVFLGSPECEPNLADSLLESVSPYLPSISTINKGLSESQNNSGILILTRLLSAGLEGRRIARESSHREDDTDSMDIDIDFDSQHSNARTESALSELSRCDIAARTSLITFECSTTATLYALSQISHESNESLVALPDTSVIIDYLVTLKPVEIVACRPFITNLLSSGLVISRTSAATLLEHLGTEILQSYEYERCEVSMGLCLEALLGLGDLWTANISDDLSETASDIYTWFINTALEGKLCSSKVQIGIANLLQTILKLNPTYIEEISQPSVRTSLFAILKDGDISVKFHIAEHASAIFGLFLLKTHEAIFEDVLQSLPNDSNWIEGIALRLLVLTRLASSWYTTLRKCIYHLFEGPGAVKTSAKHAARCLAKVTLSLGLKSPRELFKIFAPQLLFTWFDKYNFRDIPFTIYGYTDLKELLKDVEDEVIGLLVIKGLDDQALEVATLLGTSIEQLVKQSFDKVMAYSLITDIAVAPSQEYVSAEYRVRKLIGMEAYQENLEIHFVDIISHFFRSMEHEERKDKVFSKYPTFENSAANLAEIKSISSSNDELPGTMQPCFKAKYLVKCLNYLCTKIRYDFTQVWTPSLYTYVLRKLLDLLYPALGSLHACSVIRRVRILVAIAGPIALQEYPLEMILHSLRPFLSDVQCSDDTLGLVQYCFHHGSPYLSQVPSFVAGISLSILVSLRSFLNSGQEITTQESQHEGTMTKAKAFHSWLGEFLERYTSPNISGESEQAFKSITRSARDIRTGGNATRGTPESDLLIGLLEDDRSQRNLLDRPSKDLAFLILCEGFQIPKSYQEDIFGFDDDAAANAVVVWKSCRYRSNKKKYLQWAARVLGRAFVSTGDVHREMLRESESNHLKGVQLNSSTHSTSSQSAILKTLCDLLLSDKRVDVGLAEGTLQNIYYRLSGHQDETEIESALPTSLASTLNFSPYQPPLYRGPVPDKQSIGESARFIDGIPIEEWIRGVVISLVHAGHDDAIIGGLQRIIIAVDGLAGRLFPYILHHLLLQEIDSRRTIRKDLSKALESWFQMSGKSTIPHIKLLLSAILYLRNQPIPQEATKADREKWLDINYGDMAEAAACCGMYKTALLFVEIQASQALHESRRSSSFKSPVPTNLLMTIFRNVDDPDSFYGVQEPSSLVGVMERFAYERDGFKNLSFQGACFDNNMRRFENGTMPSTQGVVSALNSLSLDGLAFSLVQSQQALGTTTAAMENLYQTARKLEQWDIPSTNSWPSRASTIFRVFQCINLNAEKKTIIDCLNTEFSDVLSNMIHESQSGISVHSSLRTLAILTEMDEILCTDGSQQLLQLSESLVARSRWMQTGRFEDVSEILTNARDSKLAEIKTLLHSSQTSRSHGALQNSLSTAIYLSELVEPSERLGLEIAASTQFEGANVLWEQGEMAASIRMLKAIHSLGDLSKQDIRLGKPELLAKLGNKVSEARLEKPNEIIDKYLSVAIKELRGKSEGKEAGNAYHELASFCDQQLQNPDNIEDYKRVQRLRERSETEVRDLDKMLKTANSQAKDALQSHRKKAKQRYDLDDREYQPLRESRQAFLRQSLENYLLSLKACENFNKDALRFVALWLEQSENDIANRAVSKHLQQVPSRKFAPLMNQLSSRLLDAVDDFQSQLFPLVLRICLDHPFNSLYQVFASTHSRVSKDEVSVQRKKAMGNIVNRVKQDSKCSATWAAISSTSALYYKFALESLGDKGKPGTRIPLRKTSSGQGLESGPQKFSFPLLTLSVELRSDCNYSDVPVVAKFQPELTVMSGVKSCGADDPRQDSIMEQVFEQVSELLQSNRTTRQRNLRIRTYKVVPLTTSAVVIEFVANTIPLHEYLVPAHQKHFPKDWKSTACRKKIADVQTKSSETRIKAYRDVVDHFHPVMRYFFMENFDNPDDWFEKRLAYSRSTAAISILGHVLGLGDRHGHNILMDQETGEAVHIDLGIAFEQGRILPIPEVVPFRLTRDIVDGMGITGTEGVFRRCCEFTLEALRNESYSIMTILDVLRYDPLYSWSVSPLRMKRIQESEAPGAPSTAQDIKPDIDGVKKVSNEPGEAERALTVVAKKLSKALSVTATVNELIQQASDPRNLAVLFCGWSAWA